MGIPKEQEFRCPRCPRCGGVLIWIRKDLAHASGHFVCEDLSCPWSGEIGDTETQAAILLLGQPYNPPAEKPAEKDWLAEAWKFLDNGGNQMRTQVEYEDMANAVEQAIMLRDSVEPGTAGMKLAIQDLRAERDRLKTGLASEIDHWKKYEAMMESALEERNLALAERDRLKTELTQAREECIDRQAQVGKLIAGRDALQSQLAARDAADAMQPKVTAEQLANLTEHLSFISPTEDYSSWCAVAAAIGFIESFAGHGTNLTGGADAKIGSASVGPDPSPPVSSVGAGQCPACHGTKSRYIETACYAGEAMCPDCGGRVPREEAEAMTAEEKLRFGEAYPYHGIKPKSREEKVVLAILADLNDRRGIRQELERIDRDTRNEIVRSLVQIVRLCLPEGRVPKGKP